MFACVRKEAMDVFRIASVATLKFAMGLTAQTQTVSSVTHSRRFAPPSVVTPSSAATGPIRRAALQSRVATHGGKKRTRRRSGNNGGKRNQKFTKRK